MTSSSRTVRVFLSSTFRDFAEERDLLVRKVFPELRRKCRERQVELVDVDLRWGITEEEAQQGKVLPICLAEIDRSRPFFMGFIGERYGWVPKKDQYDLSLLLEQSWLDEHRGGKSVTELEMLHGVLNNPAMEDRAFFYFRDSAYSQAKGGAYLSEGPQEKAKLEALKDRIRQSGFPVVENYRNPEELAERVRDDLWKLIDVAFPESEVPDALARERMRHEAFTASRLGLYIGGESYFAKIDSAVAAKVRRPVLVTGDSGVGKSALLANWASRFSQNNPSAILLSHCLATGADAAQPVDMAVRILREISRITDEEIVLEGDPRKALHMLSPWLAKAGAFAAQKGGLFVLVLDGLDKMDAQHDIGWWPSMLPEGVGLVASCLSGKILDAIASRMDWEKLPVSPLQREDCETFIARHLGKYRKSLTPEFSGKVLAHPLSGNTLFLRTLLEELRVFGVHEELGPKLDHYLTSQTVDDLFERVLERVETDNSPESVRAVLEVLWAAKESFAEDELLAVSGLPPVVWAPIHIALDESLIGAGGRLAFSHDYLRKAVEDRYLPSAENRRLIQNRMAEFCAQAMAGGRKEISHYVRRHAVAHFLEFEEWDLATNALSDIEFIEERAKAQELPAMLMDYAEAVKLLPECQKERILEAARLAELDRYAKEMVEYAATCTRIRGGSGEAEPSLPLPVESVRLRTSEEIAVERRRMIEMPNRLDSVNAFQKFVGMNLAPLQNYSSTIGFAAQLAANSAPKGLPHKAGLDFLEKSEGSKFHYCFRESDDYNPLNPCAKNLEGYPGGLVYSVAFNGSRAISGGGMTEETTILWDMASGDILRKIDSACPSVMAVAMSLDGRFAITGGVEHLGIDDGFAIELWDLDTGGLIHTLIGHTDNILALAMTPDGSMAVSASGDTTVRVWDLLTGVCLKVLCGHKDQIHSIAVTPDGRRVVSGSNDRAIRIWDANTGKCLRILEGNSNPVNCLSMTSDGRRILSGDSGAKGDTHRIPCPTLRLWDTESGECIRTFTRYESNWLGQLITLQPSRTGYEDSCKALSMSADGRIGVSGPYDNNTLFVWNLETGERIGHLHGHRSEVNALMVSPDGHQAVSASNDGTLRIWDLRGDLECEYRLWGIGAMIRVAATAITLDGLQLVTGSDDKTIRLWDISTSKLNKVFTGHLAEVSAVIVAPDQQTIVSGSDDRTLRVWDRQSGECLHVLSGHDNRVWTICATPEGRRVISGSNDGTIRVWDIKTGRCLKVIEAHPRWVTSIAVSADGRRIVSAGVDRTLRIWDIDSGECLNILKGQGPVAVSPDGRYIVSDSQVWSFTTGARIAALNGHTDSINAIVVTPDGCRVVSGSSDKTLRVWDLMSGGLLSILQLPEPPNSINISAENLVCAAGDGFFGYRHEKLILNPFITTAHQTIISEDLPTGPVTARPVCCGQVISIPTAISEQIEHWAARDVGAEGGYTVPALLLDCPSCSSPLRMNPFFLNVKPAKD